MTCAASALRTTLLTGALAGTTLLLSACASTSVPGDAAAVASSTPTVTEPASISAGRTVTVRSGSVEAVITLNDSAAATEFLQSLPVTVRAREMFDYEYYGPLRDPLTTAGPLQTATEAGQVGFWTPGDQFVIYYDTPTRRPDGVLLLGRVTAGLDQLSTLGPDADLRISR